MRAFFDTSSLIPVFLEDHEHHTASLRAFLRASSGQAFCSGHGLVEFYATLTRLPGVHRLSGEQVLLFLENIRERLVVEILATEEIWELLKEAAANGITGGLAYDLIQARCALKVRANVLYTWNIKHFARLGREIARMAENP